LTLTELRHKRLTQARIAAVLGVSKSTVSRVLSRAGLSLLSDLVLSEAIDDHARIAFTAMNADERTPSAVQFLCDAAAYYAALGVSVRGLLTDNGSAFRSKDFVAACKALGVRHRFTRPYRPQNNGKAERFIQSALREWAYGFTCQHSTERTKALDRWNHQ